VNCQGIIAYSTVPTIKRELNDIFQLSEKFPPPRNELKKKGHVKGKSES